MLGSIYEKALRLQRAEGEPQWKTIKKEPSFYIWRIEKFSVVPWPKDQYGTFYQGDTFIILSIKILLISSIFSPSSTSIITGLPPLSLFILLQRVLP